MSDELKSCPFCGGTAKVQRCYGFYKVYCTECKATNLKLTSGTALDSYETRLEAIEAWNTRAERTFRWIPFEEGHDLAGPGWSCSNCGLEIGAEYEFLVEHTSYCPSCGAEEVS